MTKKEPDVGAKVLVIVDFIVGAADEAMVGKPVAAIIGAVEVGDIDGRTLGEADGWSTRWFHCRSIRWGNGSQNCWSESWSGRSGRFRWKNTGQSRSSSFNSTANACRKLQKYKLGQNMLLSRYCSPVIPIQHSIL